MVELRRVLPWFLLLILFVAAPAQAYSVLAHEAAIDASWPSVRAVLLQRFPRTTASGLDEARSYAYGGSVIQDLGYYPFGNRFFSNLLHYTRSGDFVEALIHDARDVNELAFGLGALAHYITDNTGHPEAVNRSVPLLFPKLVKKFGHDITYVEAPRQHIVAEFSFDIVEVAKGAYAPDAYRQFIGFQVAKRVLAQAFRETYGLELKQQFASEDRAIGTYRYAVSQIVPAVTAAAWRDKQDEIMALAPQAEREKFVFAFRRAEFEREYGRDYQRPGLFARVIAAVYRLVPKIGPLRALAFKAPTREAQALFEESFRNAGTRYRSALEKVRTGRPDFVNTDFDTGRPTRHGEYPLADETYAQLLQKLEERRFVDVPIALRRNVLAFYGQQPRPSTASKDDVKHWDRVEVALTELARPR